MQLNQIINLSEPLAHWTAERFGDDNVYDEVNNHSLVNFNATLGEIGSQNFNLSSRSINLKGGHLQVLNTTFAESNLNARTLIISFGFKLPGRDKSSPIAGFKPIISKWNPEQQYMIGFEDGILTAKIQTNNGLIELDHDLPDVIYNNRWNWVNLIFTPSDIQFVLNGIVVSNSESSPVVASTNSLFTVGGQNSEVFADDVLINNLSVCGKLNDHFIRASYVLPRNTKELWLDMNPTHYFVPGDTLDLTKPLINHGSSDALGYIVYPPNGPAPYLYQIDPAVPEMAVRMPSNSFLTIDTPDLEFDVNQGVSIVVDGRYDRPADDYNPRHAMRLFDLRNNLADDNGRGYISFNYTNSSSYYDWFSWKVWDATGTLLDGGPNANTYRLSAHYHYDYGVKMYNLKPGVLNTVHFDVKSAGATKQYNNLPFNFSKTTTLPVNRFWYNTGANGAVWADLREFAIYNWEVPVSAVQNFNYPRFMIMHYFLINNRPSYFWNFYGYNSTSPNIRYHRGHSDYNPDQYTSGLSIPNDIIDPNHNRINDFSGAVYLAGTGNYTGGHTSQDDMDLNSNDFTTTAFFWNRNTTSRYRVMNNTGAPFEVWMNSRNGEFSYGNIEVRLSTSDSAQWVWTDDNTFIDDGFHHFAFIRKGFELQIWVDGQLNASKITPSVVNLGYNSRTMRMYGGPVYFNHWTIFTREALTPEEIEWMFGGFNDTVKGQCTLDGQALPSTLLATSVFDGRVVKTHATGIDGKFDFSLPKTEFKHRINVLALAQDDNASNNVVVHGPYNMNTVYSKYSEEVLDVDLSEMILDMQPYAYYKMDETTGTVINDSSGNERHGTIMGGITLDQPSVRSDLKSIAFNGVDGYVDLPDGFDDFTGGFTFEGWIKYDSFKNWSRIFDLASGESGVDCITFANETTSDNLRLSIKNGTADGGIIGKVDALNIGNWQHIVARIAPDGTWSLWLNGSKVSEETGLSVPSNIVRTLTYFGKSTYPNDAYFDGRMSNTAFYDYPLSDEDIAKHAYVGFNKNLKTLKSVIMQDQPDLYFPFDRVNTYLEEMDRQLTLTKYGSFDVDRNALVFNKDMVGNNWLKADYRIPTGDGWTVEFCIKIGTSQTDAIVISEWDQSGDTGTYKVQLDAADNVKVFIGDGTTVMQSTATVVDDQWHHVVVMYSQDTVYLYVDGELESTLTVGMNYGVYDTAIGNSSDGSTTHHFESTAVLDDVAIYSKAIGEVRVTEHYNQFLKKKVYQ